MKKNYLKNIIVFVLCAVVLAGAVSVPAFAEDTEPAEEESAHLRHIHTDQPVTVMVDGLHRQAVVKLNR